MSLNPLDACGRAQFQCNNPCNHAPGCDLLPTQIDTFTTQFFGNGLGKSNVGGSVSWDLPCGLDVGISDNPKLSGESLSCYFLRLFEAGIPGTLGPAGENGATGAPGADAFSFTAQAFDQPTLAQPYVSLLTHPAPSILQGLFVEIENSGFYTILNLAADGTALLQLLSPLPGAPAVIPSGALIVPGGIPGINVKGPKGLQGDQGAQGPVGPKGVKGDKGQQGDPGDSHALISGINGYYPFNANHPPTPNPGGLLTLNAAYQLLGTNAANTIRFTTPDSSLATYYLFFRIWSYITAPSPMTGSNTFKIVGPAGDVAGALRVNAVSAYGATVLSSWTTVPLVVTNNTGAIATWSAYGKTSMAGFLQGAAVNLGFGGVSWTRIVAP